MTSRRLARWRTAALAAVAAADPSTRPRTSSRRAPTSRKRPCAAISLPCARWSPARPTSTRRKATAPRRCTGLSYRGRPDLVEALLKAGANPKAANRDGSTPLWLASINGDAAVIRALLDAGADVNEALPLGRTPLMAAARTGSVEAVTLLLDRGARVNAAETLRGTTALMWAADEGHADAARLLIRRGADVAARSAPAQRGRGPALGKSNDPRKQVAAQGAALAAGRALDLTQVLAVDGDGGPRRRAEPTRRGRADPARLRRARQRPRHREGAARSRRRHQPGDRLRLESPAGRHAEPLLRAGRLPPGSRRGPEPPEQGRVDAALSGDRQPQHRERRLSGSQGGHGSPGVHPPAARQRGGRERPREGQHRDPHRLHEPVAGRERRHAVPARVAVRRSRADEAPALEGRGPEDRHGPRRHGPARGLGHRLGRRHHLRVVAAGHARGGDDCCWTSVSTSTRRPTPAGRRSMAPRTRGAPT